MPKRRRSSSGGGGKRRRTGGNVGGTSYSRVQYRGGGGSGYRTGGFTGQEVKFLDKLKSFVVPIDSAALSLCTADMCSPTPGSGSTQRDGRAVHAKRLTIRGSIELKALALGGTETLPGYKIRMVLVKDTQNNSSTAASNVTGAGAPLSLGGASTQQLVDCFADLEQQRRFKILSDRTISIGYGARAPGRVSGDAHTVGGVIKNFMIDKRLNMPIQYAAAGGTGSDIVDNNLQLYSFAAASGSNPGFTIPPASEISPVVMMTSRFRFTG